MWTRQKRKTKIERIIFYMGSILIATYYLYHCYGGAYGLQAYGIEEQNIAKLNIKLSSLLKEREELSKKVALLREPTINRDSLEEYARQNLNLARANELVVLTN